MEKEVFKINEIPAMIWGKKSEKVFIHVHGKMSRKEYAENFARLAEEAGYQTLSFDLPQHGERTDSEYRCDVWNGKRDLNLIADYAYGHWKSVSLFACSLGAYFSLQTYTDRPFEKTMFQSPIVDMRWLVEHMMLWSEVNEEMLEVQKEIETSIDVLRWDYYCYIKEHPIRKWHKNTAILYGDLDDLQDKSCITEFAEKFGANLTISEGSKHPFMEERDFSIVEKWMKESVGDRK